MADKLTGSISWSNNYFDVEGEPKNLKITQKVGGSVAIPTDGKHLEKIAEDLRNNEFDDAQYTHYLFENPAFGWLVGRFELVH